MLIMTTKTCDSILCRSISCLFLSGLLSAVTACGGDAASGTNSSGNTPPLPTPGLHILAGAGVADTVDTAPLQSLTVQLADASGQPVRGTVVRFTATAGTIPGPYPLTTSTMLVSDLKSAAWTSFVSVSTDSSGLASVLVRLGAVAGTGMILVNAPTAGLLDTAKYTVRAGNPVRITVAPRDTALFVGGTAAMRATAADRYGNSRNDAATYTTTNSHISVSGGVVSGATIGRSMVSARVGTFRDSMFVSVVPRGTIAAYVAMRSTGDQLAVYTFDLDGSHFRQLVNTVIFAGYFGEMPPVWSQDGKSIFYHDNKNDHTRMLMVVDAASGVSRRLIAPSLQLPDERRPTRSADGQWVYFNGPDYGVSQAYRVKTDGSIRELLTPGGATQSYPQPSPDGTQIVYVSSSKLETMTLATKVVKRLGNTAVLARWSPSGSYIAYKDDGVGLWIVRPDGTGARQVAAQTQFDQFFDWSPDEQYIVATASGTVALVDVNSGEVLPISITAKSIALASPSWKP